MCYNLVLYVTKETSQSTLVGERNNEPPTVAESSLCVLRCACWCWNWYLLPELATRTPNPVSWRSRSGSQLISATARSAWGRSLVMAAPQRRANYFCLLSLYTRSFTHLLALLRRSSRWPVFRTWQSTEDRAWGTASTMWGYVLRLKTSTGVNTLNLSHRPKIRQDSACLLHTITYCNNSL